jgi:hypothetical protein
MSLMLIHPYHYESSPYPACDFKKAIMPRDNLVLCFDRNKTAIEQDQNKKTKRISRINYPARSVLWLICMTTMIVIFNIGFGISCFFQAVRSSVYGTRRRSPESNLKNNVGPGHDCAGPGSAYPNKSGRNILYLPCLKNS